MSEEARLYYKLMLSVVVVIVGLMFGLSGLAITVIERGTEWELYGWIVMSISVPFFGMHRAMLVDGVWREYFNRLPVGPNFEQKPLGEWEEELDKEFGYE